MIFKSFIIAGFLLATSYTWNKDMEVDGMFEGDIEVTPEQMDRLSKGTNEFGSIIGGRWPDGKIPYVIESSIGSHGRQQIQAALNGYHQHTCLRFTPRTNERAYISFYNGQGCHSPVGRTGGVNRVSLQYPGCQNKGTIQHEIGHSIGLLHEQSRPDRDQFVRINYNALSNSQLAYNFQKASNINSLGTPYDLHSMMHYSSTAFARSGMKTITTVDPSKQHIIDTYNRITGFSTIDIKQINLMYNCGGSGGGGGGGEATNVPQTTTTSSGCEDKDTNCYSWARGGYCNDAQHKDWMKANCCKSCSSGGGSSCGGDKHSSCSNWARNGYCRSRQYYQYMKQNCCKSCGY